MLSMILHLKLFDNMQINFWWQDGPEDTLRSEVPVAYVYPL